MEIPALYARRIESRIAETLQDTPVVLLAGPRQASKTTLVRQIAADNGLRYLTLDDELTLLSAREDPVGMIRSLDRAVIDEIQRAPQLLLAIKKSVDEDRRPGRFLLTGSANLMALPTVADSLAGRMETLSLLPLSQSEIEGRSANWIDSVFSGQILKPSAKCRISAMDQNSFPNLPKCCCIRGFCSLAICTVCSSAHHLTKMSCTASSKQKWGRFTKSSFGAAPSCRSSRQ